MKEEAIKPRRQLLEGGSGRQQPGGALCTAVSSIYTRGRFMYSGVIYIHEGALLYELYAMPQGHDKKVTL